MAISKVVYGNQTLIDLTNDTVNKDNLLAGATAHGKDGEIIQGACTFDADTSDANADANEILAGRTAYVRGQKRVGTMENRAGEGGTISDKSELYTIRSGYHDGSGTVGIDEVEKNKIIAGNIKSGVTILGVEGTYSGEGGVGQKKTATPTKEGFSVLPDSGYDYLTEVEVNPIPYTETSNVGGGITATIAGV